MRGSPLQRSYHGQKRARFSFIELVATETTGANHNLRGGIDSELLRRSVEACHLNAIARAHLNVNTCWFLADFGCWRLRSNIS